jgi:NADH:ubiquinone oxidoreductase subunit 6 (subunit J)/NADH:ubiquinone oxidoreductase subunit 3 (subunit A)
MTGLEFFPGILSMKFLLTSLAIIAAIFVIGTKNAIISIFNLIVLYILVAFYLIYIGITYLGISYIIIYIGAIAILFLFIIMMIDIEVVEKRSNNHLPLLFLLLGGFIVTFKNGLSWLGIVKIKSLLYKEPVLYLDNISSLFNYNQRTSEILTSNLSEMDQIFLQEAINESNREQLIPDITNKIINNLYEFDKINIDTLKENKLTYQEIISFPYDNSYLLITPDWDYAISRVTQISAIGDVLYTVYHSYIYIVSVILLLAMIGAIILTAGNTQYTKVLNIERHKNSGFCSPKQLFIILSNIINKLIIVCGNNYSLLYKYIQETKLKYNNINNNNFVINSLIPLFSVIDSDKKHSEGVIGTLFYYIISNLILGVLLLFINSTFSLSVKYLEKGGGFECGFSSFVQTRERYNIIFYRVSLLFLVFDLEIILAFPYTALYHKDQNIGKNNVLAFLYILIVGFIYELKEGALNIVKTAHTTDTVVNKAGNYPNIDTSPIKIVNYTNINERQFNNIRMSSHVPSTVVNEKDHFNT